jgi:SPP1 gp7 family putative phage head morphogenesis protein
MASAVAREIATFRSEIDATSATPMRNLRRGYQTIIDRTAQRADALAREINAMRAAGEIVSKGRLVRMERYEMLLAELQRNARGYSLDVAAPAVTSLQEQNVWLAQEHASRIERVIVGPERVAQFQAQFVMPPRDAIEAIVGTMGDSGNVANYLAETLPDATVRKVGDALIEGIGSGLNPREVGRIAAKASGIGLTRATLVARTEMNRAYSESQRQRWDQSGLVRMYRRTSAQNSRTCLGCIAMDGTVFATREEIEDHPGGRCVAVPVFVIDGEIIQPPMQDAQDWLAEQPKGVQQEVMGPTRWAAWKRGDVGIKEMAQYRPNARFGGAWVPRNVRDIVDGNPVDRVTREAQARSVHQIVA